MYLQLIQGTYLCKLHVILISTCLVTAPSMSLISNSINIYINIVGKQTNKQTKNPNTPQIKKKTRPIPLNDPAEHPSDSVCPVSWQSFPVLPEISRFHPKSHMKAILLCNIPMQYCSAAVFPDCHYITRAKEREPGPFIGPKKLKNIQLSSIKTLLRQKSWKPMSPHLPQIKAHFKTSISSNS